MSRSGYTLPVFACASAVAALHWLRDRQPISIASVYLIEPNEIAEIPIEQEAGLSENAALAITRSDPGDNLDLTKDTPIWALVEYGGEAGEDEETVIIKGGEGIGRQINADDKPAIYAYAQRLLKKNLQRHSSTGGKNHGNDYFTRRAIACC